MSNPLLDDLSTPVVTITLPTQGLFYTDDIIDKTIDLNDAPVYAFSLAQEAAYQDVYRIIGGTATSDLVKQCAPWVAKPLELANCDIEMIMIGARIASYGEKLELDVTCGNPETHEVPSVADKTKMVSELVCGRKTSVKLDLTDLMAQYPTLDNPKDWTLKVGTNTVYLRPARMKDELAVVKMMVTEANRMQALASGELPTDPDKAAEFVSGIQASLAGVQISSSYLQLKSSIASIKTAKGVEVRDEDQITEWLQKIAPQSLSRIREKIVALMEPFKSAGNFDFECPLCGHKTPQIPAVSNPEVLFSGGFTASPSAKPYTS